MTTNTHEGGPEFDPKVIRHLLEAESISAAELARRVGVARSLVGAWLAGVTTPQVGTLCRLAGVFGLPISHFFQESTGVVMGAKGARDD